MLVFFYQGPGWEVLFHLYTSIYYYDFIFIFGMKGHQGQNFTSEAKVTANGRPSLHLYGGVLFNKFTLAYVAQCNLDGFWLTEQKMAFGWFVLYILEQVYSSCIGMNCLFIEGLLLEHDCFCISLNALSNINLLTGGTCKEFETICIDIINIANIIIVEYRSWQLQRGVTLSPKIDMKLARYKLYTKAWCGKDNKSQVYCVMV